MNIPSKLSYQRSISPGHAVFYSQDSQGNLKPLEISETTILGQKSSSTEGYDSSMKEKQSVTPKKFAEGNIQRIDYCFSPPDSSLILNKFSLRIDASSITPFTCNDQSVTTTMELFSQKFRELGGYRLLATRYLKNILSGAWLWRNQEVLNTDIEVISSNGTTYQVSNIHRKRFEDGWEASVDNWNELVAEFEAALITPKSYLLLEVTAKLKMGFTQEIHPSQSFSEKEHTKSSRVYQNVLLNNKRIPIMGTCKVGAAIACIDDWYADGADKIRVSPYGVDKINQTSYRSPETQKSLFSYLLKLESLIQQMTTTELVSGECHFVAANLIKGGLFQVGKKA